MRVRPEGSPSERTYRRQSSGHAVFVKEVLASSGINTRDRLRNSGSADRLKDLATGPAISDRGPSRNKPRRSVSVTRQDNLFPGFRPAHQFG